MKARKLTALPALPPAWVAARARTTRAWHRLAPREQRLVTLAGLVVGAVLLWVLAFEPAWQSVSSLQSRLPQLRAQTAQLDTVLGEIRDLQAGDVSGALPVNEVAAALTDSLQRAGLEDSAKIHQPTASTWQVNLEQAPVAPVLQWLQTLPYELRLSTPHVTLARSAGPDGRQLAGRFSGHIVVSLPEGGT